MIMLIVTIVRTEILLFPPLLLVIIRIICRSAGQYGVGEIFRTFQTGPEPHQSSRTKGASRFTRGKPETNKGKDASRVESNTHTRARARSRVL
jgi:hypothetical protein